MSKIQRLDDLTINQIAAGEVIERPVSLVKELVENALDAGAAHITVEMDGGGLTQLKVSDDGCGMSEEDLLIAIQRHATSKLRNIADFNEITSLGFRGEALPSILSVAHLEITSREDRSDFGTRLVGEGNKVLSIAPTGSPVGTTIVVSNLFFNTPARKKFMRTPNYESALIHEKIMHFSLSHPEVNFRLRAQGKELLDTTGISDIPDLLSLFYGTSVKETLVTFKSPVSQGEVAAYLTLPSYHRANRKGIHVFMNARKILSKEILAALEASYENTLPKGQFPVALLYVTMSPALLDVNVHPSKMEIRLRDDDFCQALTHKVKDHLMGATHVPSYIFPTPAAPPSVKESEQDPHQQNTDLPTNLYPQAQGEPSRVVQESWQAFTSPVSPSITKLPPITTHTPRSNDVVLISDIATPMEAMANSQEVEKSLPFLEVLGQLNQTIILAQGAQDLYLIDQHVAHERILFEDLLRQYQNGAIESQVLLTPVPIQLTALEEAILLEYILPLKDCGLLVEYFGPHSYLIRAVPACLKSTEPQDFLFDILHKLENGAQQVDPTKVMNKLLLTASCKAAVKAGQKLSQEAMNSLINNWRLTINPLTCPHGRPIIYQIPYKQILKFFGRH